MNAHRFLIAVGAAVVLVSSTLAVSASTSAAPASLAKKRCHIVKKKVHGKVKRVRVCPKPKPKPKPKNVSVSLEQSGQTKVAIGEAGGSISAAAASGAKLTLSIPAGSLSGKTEVTLTPVAAVRGLPKGIKFVAGAQFAPEGLSLDKPAMLTIETSKAAGARTVAWFGLGKDVSRYPSTRSGNAIQIRIAHFSGVAAAQGPAAAWSGVPDAVAALRARFMGDVKPGLAGAETQDPLSSGAFGAAFAWEREVELLGLGGSFGSEKAQIRDALAKAIPAAIQRASTACADRHDLTQVERLTRLDRIAQLWGIQVLGGSGFERAVKCAQFELDMEYRVTRDLHTSSPSEDHTISGELSVKASKLPIALVSSTLEGEGPLEVTSWHYVETVVEHQGNDPPVTCTVSAISASPSRKLHVSLEIDPVGIPIRGFPELALTVTPGAVTWALSGFCESPPSSATTDVPGLFPGDTGVPGATAYRIPVAAPFGHFVGGEVYATYGPETVSGTIPGGLNYTMTRSFVLRHTPER